MVMNYAEKYAGVVDERFTKGSFTDALVNQNFDWIGVQSVHVFSRNLATLNDYTASGANRYGTPDELENAEQEMTISQDKAFTYTIDMKTSQDTNGTMEAGATLAENISNVVIPEVDKYRLGKIIAGAPTAANADNAISASHVIQKAVTNANAFEEWLAAQEILDNDNAPAGGRIGVATPGFVNKLKLDDNFSKASDVAMGMNIRGFVGMADGVPVISVPAKYFPAGVDFVITNPIACVGPVKLSEYKIHYDAPGISGALVEGRIRFDAFVLNKKAAAIVVHKAAA